MTQTNLFQVKPRSSYPKDILKNIKLITLQAHPDVTQIMGSSLYRDALYPADIDVFEHITKRSKNEAIRFFVKSIQRIVKNVTKLKEHYFLEVKAGIDPRFDLSIGKVVNNVYHQDPNLQLTIEKYANEGLFDKKEANELIEILKEKTSDQIVYETIKSRLRQHYIIRWNKNEIAKNKKVLPLGQTITLNQAVDNRESMVNIELLVVINGRLVDMSNFYVLGYIYKGKQYVINVSQEIIDNFKTYFLNILKRSMDSLIHSKLEYNPLKYCKRIYSYCKYVRDEKTAKLVLPLINGDLGRMYQVKSEINAIIKLMDSKYKYELPVKVIQKEIEEIKFKIGSFPVEAFSNHELTMINNMIDNYAYKKDKYDLYNTLKLIKWSINDYVNEQTTRELHRIGLLPIPPKFKI